MTPEERDLCERFDREALRWVSRAPLRVEMTPDVVLVDHYYRLYQSTDCYDD